MKKYIHMMTAAVAFMCLAACTEKLGTEPGNDPAPHATIYQYNPGAGYNSDEDIVVRFVANNKAESVHYLVELLADILCSGIGLDNLNARERLIKHADHITQLLLSAACRVAQTLDNTSDNKAHNW